MTHNKAIWALAILALSAVVFFTWPIKSIYIDFPLDILLGIVPFIILAAVSFFLAKSSLNGKNKPLAMMAIVISILWALFLVFMAYLAFALRNL